MNTNYSGVCSSHSILWKSFLLAIICLACINARAGDLPYIVHKDGFIPARKIKGNPGTCLYRNHDHPCLLTLERFCIPLIWSMICNKSFFGFFQNFSYEEINHVL